MTGAAGTFGSAELHRPIAVDDHVAPVTIEFLTSGANAELTASIVMKIAIGE